MEWRANTDTTTKFTITSTTTTTTTTTSTNLVGTDQPGLALLGFSLQFLFLAYVVVVLGLECQESILHVTETLFGSVQYPLRLRQVLLRYTQCLALGFHRLGHEVVLVHCTHPLTDGRAGL